ncbi:MAG: phenylacetate--CoA ligase family protein [Candidatus Woesearchaeota archaeon]|nr:MAG: phenylacetate--CoA ligase family protein [Candidatus Woesearchaeota archaeon]
MKNITKQVYKGLILPFRGILSGYSILEAYKLLRKTQYLPKKELEKLQLIKLKEIVKHAYETVPYYNKKFKEYKVKPDDIKTLKDIKKLPILTREDVFNNFPNNIVSNSYIKTHQKGLTLGYTGGSSGNPLKFYKDSLTMSMLLACQWRGWSYGGYKIGDKIALLGGSSLVPFLGSSLKSKFKLKFSSFIKRMLPLSAYTLDEETMNVYIKKLIKYKPDIIIGYPSALKVLAEHIESKNIMTINPKSVHVTSEMLFQDQRKAIEKNFNCKVFDGYGSGEAIVSAFECEQHNGLHLTAETGITEIIGNEMIVTSILNKATPFIRYKIGDKSKFINRECSCGRPLPLIDHIQGREGDFLIGKNNRKVSTVGLTLMFGQAKVKEYQLIQESKNKIIVRIVKDKDYSNKKTEYITNSLERWLGNGIDIDIQFVDKIPLTKAGKRIVLIKKI